MRFSQVAFSVTPVAAAVSQAAGPISGNHRQRRAQFTSKNGQDAQAPNQKLQGFVRELVLQRWRRGVHAWPGRTVRKRKVCHDNVCGHCSASRFHTRNEVRTTIKTALRVILNKMRTLVPQVASSDSARS
jgi:hypothetical protein